ncbi:unnamed protein product, partial [Laminaria digitata]
VFPYQLVWHTLAIIMCKTLLYSHYCCAQCHKCINIAALTPCPLRCKKLFAMSPVYIAALTPCPFRCKTLFLIFAPPDSCERSATTSLGWLANRGRCTLPSPPTRYRK